MLTWEEDMEIHALKKRGMSISAIARHTGKNRRTVRNYLNGTTTPGVRTTTTPDPFEKFVDYIRARLLQDPHLWAITLFDELVELGFLLSYQTLTRKIRQQNLRPICLSCSTATNRANAVIEHPPGEETQWDYVDLPNPPTAWSWGKTAHLWVGALAHSGKWRAVLTPSMDQPHLVDGLDRVVRALGGITAVWRFDRMATVCHPDSGRVTASFAGVAKHYGVSVAICPPRRGNRKGVVEKANHTAAQRWWRSLPDMSVEQAQAHLDDFCATIGDARPRRCGDGMSTVAALAAAEPLQQVPATAHPVFLGETRTASRQALVSYRGNQYSVPPELASAQVTVTQPVGGHHLDIVTTSGITVARHLVASDGTGTVVRDSGHVLALETAAMAGANTGRPHRRKERIPPGADAVAAAQVLRRNDSHLVREGDGQSEKGTAAPRSDVIDMAAYERAAKGRNTLT
ncbi:IS21 family transposase [Rhodococcus sp. ARC_M6]|uniref:Mu transposase domain-containing protein n=1 Tax=Rhodococcus sp. ARC_M6 TaxID=2928852 RepID=UPI001FB247BC|nr:IS21 family transposase [Rhodococcus sp. ARC_M6]MCJ0907399.1 IS21 family transposase [Rhodococcus sp. ARC_M6]